ncbi:MAG: corrinoid protein [Chloroflexi bacterium]|nr:corrinoid protein [Chloroflexota bacterium]
MSEILRTIASKLYQGEDTEVSALVQQALNAQLTAQEILANGLIAGMNNVGRDFKTGDLYVPEVLCAARAMHAGMNLLRPLLSVSDIPTAGKCVIGTVKGDLHDIGKNLVRMMLEGAGFETIDLGVDVKTETFVAAVREHKPELLGMSALLTTTMVEMKSTLAALDQAGLRQSVRVMVGGAPVTSGYASQIGADAFAPDAATAVEIARRLVG